MNTRLTRLVGRRAFFGLAVVSITSCVRAIDPVVSPSLKLRIDAHLAKAEKTCQDSANKVIAEIDSFFRRCSQSVPAFINDATGWYSYGYCIADLAPYTSHTRLRNYLNARFRNYFFSAESLAAFLNQQLKNFQADIEEAENILLRDVAADIDGLAPAQPGATSESILRSKYQTILAKAEKEVKISHATSTAVFFNSIALGAIIVQVMKRVAAALAARTGSKGLAAVGVAGGPLGIICTAVLEYLLMWAWDWWTDPKGKMAVRLKEQFNGIRSMIIDGVDGQRGLKAELQALLDARKTVRGQMVNDAVRETLTSSKK